MVEIASIDMYRDGGSIAFTVTGGGQLDGRYHLQSPFNGEPRLLIKDAVQLELGGPEERVLASAMEAWFSAQMSGENRRRLTELSALASWTGLSPELRSVVPLHRIRFVIDYLRSR